MANRSTSAWAEKTLDRCALFDTLQGQPWKMTETPPRLRWACRPVGKDNASVYLKYLGIGKAQLHDLKKQQVI